MGKITFEAKHKLEKIASTDETRPSVNRIIIGSDWVAATDGHALVKVPAKVERIDGDPSREMVDLLEIKSARILCKKLVDVTATSKQHEVSSPPILPVIPDGSRVADYEIGIDVDLLTRVAAAIGTTRLRLRFGGPLDPIEVTPSDQDVNTRTIVGVVMPMRIDAKGKGKGKK